MAAARCGSEREDGPLPAVARRLPGLRHGRSRLHLRLLLSGLLLLLGRLLRRCLRLRRSLLLLGCCCRCLRLRLLVLRSGDSLRCGCLLLLQMLQVLLLQLLQLLLLLLCRRKGCRRGSTSGQRPGCHAWHARRCYHSWCSRPSRHLLHLGLRQRLARRSECRGGRGSACRCGCRGRCSWRQRRQQRRRLQARQLVWPQRLLALPIPQLFQLFEAHDLAAQRQQLRLSEADAAGGRVRRRLRLRRARAGRASMLEQVCHATHAGLPGNAA